MSLQWKTVRSAKEELEMSATALMSIKLDADEKALFAENAEALGITPSSAVKIFVRQFS